MGSKVRKIPTKQVPDVDQRKKEGGGELLIKCSTLIQLHSKRGGLLQKRTKGVVSFCKILQHMVHICEQNKVCLEQEVEYHIFLGKDDETIVFFLQGSKIGKHWAL